MSQLSFEFSVGHIWPTLEAAEKAFYEWIDVQFPADPAVSGSYGAFRVCRQLTLDRLAPRTYSSEDDLQRDGSSLFLRPWQLPHRVDYGLRGTCDGDPFHGN